MKEWFSAAEIAALGLPGLPVTESGMIRLAKAKAWPHRERSGLGGGREYPLSALPEVARAAYVARHVAELAPVPQIGTAVIEVPDAPTVAAAHHRDARLAILGAADRFAAAAGLGRKRADELFSRAYDAGVVEVADWVRDAVPSVVPRTLARWRARVRVGETHRLAVDQGAGRRGSGVLDVAAQGAVKSYCLALLSKNPLFTADHIRDAVGGEWGVELALPTGELVPLPSLRTFQDALKKWREAHKVELAAIADPDGYKSKYRLTGRGMLAHIRRPNQLWMIDASPVDMLCVDGRHTMYVAIDLATRRILIYITRTPRAEGVGLLMRRALMSWGVPEEVKTDNGSDFVARSTRSLLDHIGIEQITSAPFSPEEKAHVERAIGTVQRGLIRLLPGFIGHSVADRKIIEGRKSFAERLGEDPREALCVELTAAEVQRYADEWVRVKYEQSPHEGLGRATPAQAAAASSAPIRMVDEAALDVLLAPVAGGGGVRTVTKSGVQVDHNYYVATGIMPGTQVLVRMDPMDLGLARLFTPDGIRYLGEATCLHLSGIDPREALKARKAEQSRYLEAATAPIKREARRIGKGARIVDVVLRHNAREAGKLVEFPRRTEAHTTPALDAAAEAAGPRRAPTPRVSEEVRALRDQLAAEPAAPVVRPLRAADTPKARWARATDLKRRAACGEALSADESTWLSGYVQSAEYKGFADTYGDPDDEIPAVAG